MALAYSPPAPIDCASRQTSSSTGARMPTLSYVGSSPMAAVPAQVTTIVNDSERLRPNLSPIRPNRMPPTGRAM